MSECMVRKDKPWCDYHERPERDCLRARIAELEAVLLRVTNALKQFGYYGDVVKAARAALKAWESDQSNGPVSEKCDKCESIPARKTWDRKAGKWIDCEKCGGLGRLPSRADTRCKNCGGIGTVPTLDSAGRGPCPRCGGSGKEPNEKGEHAQEGG